MTYNDKVYTSCSYHRRGVGHGTHIQDRTHTHAHAQTIHRLIRGSISNVVKSVLAVCQQAFTEHVEEGGGKGKGERESERGRDR